MKLMQSLRHIWKTIKRNRSTIMSVVSVAGVVWVFGTTIAANNDANERRHEAQAEKGENLTTWERIKAEAPAYIFPGLLTAGTSALIMVNDSMNVKKFASLTAAAALAGRAYRVLSLEEKKELAEQQAKENVEKVPEKPKNTEDPLRLFYDSFSDRYFWLTNEEERLGEINAANHMLYYGAATLNELYDWWDLDRIPGGDDIGWDVYLGEVVYGYNYIQIEHEEVTLADGTKCTALVFPFAPHPFDEEMC